MIWDQLQVCFQTTKRQLAHSEEIKRVAKNDQIYECFIIANKTMCYGDKESGWSKDVAVSALNLELQE